MPAPLVPVDSVHVPSLDGKGNPGRLPAPAQGRGAAHRTRSRDSRRLPRSTSQRPTAFWPAACNTTARPWTWHRGCWPYRAWGSATRNVDLQAATERGIAVTYTPDGPTIATAEHALALIFAVAKDLKNASHDLIHDRRPDHYGRHSAVEIFGARIGLVGLGPNRLPGGNGAGSGWSPGCRVRSFRRRGQGEGAGSGTRSVAGRSAGQLRHRVPAPADESVHPSPDRPGHSGDDEARLDPRERLARRTG